MTRSLLWGLVLGAALILSDMLSQLKMAPNIICPFVTKVETISTRTKFDRTCKIKLKFSEETWSELI